MVGPFPEDEQLLGQLPRAMPGSHGTPGHCRGVQRCKHTGTRFQLQKPGGPSLQQQ